MVSSSRGVFVRSTGVVHHASSSARPTGGEAVRDAPFGIRITHLLDEAVAHEAVECRVDLPDVERPGAAGAPSNSLRSWAPYFSPSASSAMSPDLTDIVVHPLAEHGIPGMYLPGQYEMYTEYLRCPSRTVKKKKKKKKGGGSGLRMQKNF